MAAMETQVDKKKKHMKKKFRKVIGMRDVRMT